MKLVLFYFVLEPTGNMAAGGCDCLERCGPPILKMMILHICRLADRLLKTFPHPTETTIILNHHERSSTALHQKCICLIKLLPLRDAFCAPFETKESAPALRVAVRSTQRPIQPSRGAFLCKGLKVFSMPKQASRLVAHLCW